MTLKSSSLADKFQGPKTLQSEEFYGPTSVGQLGARQGTKILQQKNNWDFRGISLRVPHHFVYRKEILRNTKEISV